MATQFAKFQLIGHVTNQPFPRKTHKGQKSVQIPIAINAHILDKKNKKSYDKCTYIEVYAFGELSRQVISQICTGDLIYADGYFESSMKNGADGKKVNTFFPICRTVTFLASARARSKESKIRAHIMSALGFLEECDLETFERIRLANNPGATENSPEGLAWYEGVINTLVEQAKQFETSLLEAGNNGCVPGSIQGESTDRNTQQDLGETGSTESTQPTAAPIPSTGKDSPG